MQKLVIYIHAHDVAPSWAIVDDASGLIEYMPKGNVDELARLSADKKVIVIVPASEVLLVSAKLPAMNRSRLTQALPFALEEQLTVDVDTLHFVPGENQADGHLPVAVVSKEKMQSWLNLLKAWNIQADILMPQTMELPVEENTLTIVVGDLAIVRMGAYQGFACDISNLNEFIEIAESHPQTIHIQNYTQQEVALAIKVQANIKEDFHSPEKMETDLALNAGQFPYLNLLQGSFKTRKSRFPEMRKIWKAAIYLAAAWIFLLFLYPTISYFILKQRVNNINTQITEIYKRNFPQASSVVAPKLRMEEKLQRLTSESGESRLLMLVGYIGKGMMETPSINLKRLDFQNNQVTLDLIAGNSEDLSKFSEFLTREGLNVKQQSANLTGVRVNAIITVE